MTSAVIARQAMQILSLKLLQVFAQAHHADADSCKRFRHSGLCWRCRAVSGSLVLFISIPGSTPLSANHFAQALRGAAHLMREFCRRQTPSLLDSRAGIPGLELINKENAGSGIFETALHLGL